MAVGRKARGEYAKSAGRREEILDATVKVFAGSGFHGGSIRDIAERVGISQAGLLHHFANKEALLEAVLTRRDELATERMGAQATTGAGLLDALVELSAYNQTTPGLVALFTVLSGEATAADHPGHDFFRRRYDDLRALIRDAVRRGQQDGELRPDLDAEQVARTMIALLDGLQLQWLYDPTFELATPARAYVDSLRTGKAGRPSRRPSRPEPGQRGGSVAG